LLFHLTVISKRGTPVRYFGHIWHLH
jgi:hypothetical protein